MVMNGDMHVGLIIGGAFQGKLEYAKKLYPKIQWIDGENCSPEELESASGVNHFELFIKRKLKETGDVSDFASDLIQKNPCLC